jgi:hypothetical protein
MNEMTNSEKRKRKLKFIDLTFTGNNEDEFIDLFDNGSVWVTEDKEKGKVLHICLTSAFYDHIFYKLNNKEWLIGDSLSMIVYVDEYEEFLGFHSAAHIPHGK